MRVGILVNPVAGMGGSVGLKGTDGDALRMARERGAVPSSELKAERALRHADLSGVELVTAPGALGGDLLRRLGLEHTVLTMETEGDRRDTIVATALMIGSVDLLVFCGGDGTARDILESGRQLVLGIPAGVKMHSGVFASTPEAAGDLLRRFLKGDAQVNEGEVMDIDEEAYRQGHLSARLHGYLDTLEGEGLMPGSKGPSTADDKEEREEIGQYLADVMAPDALYLIGPGSTAKSCMESMGLEHTLLGVDAVKGGMTVAKDLTEKEILSMIGDGGATVVVGVIGKQGFIFGRGNQQFTPSVLERSGLSRLVILCTPRKLSITSKLRVDTGDPALDDKLRGRRRVLIGYGKERIVEVV